MKRYAWIFAWLICLAVSFGLYVYTALTEAARPPEPGWSRAQVLAVLTDLDAYGLWNNDAIIRFNRDGADTILFQEPGRGLQMLVIGSDGMLSGRKTLDAGFKTADKLQVYRQGGDWCLTALQGRALSDYRLDGDTLTPLDSVYPAEIRDFDRKDGRDALITEKGLVLADGLETLADEPGCSEAKWLPGNSERLCMITEQNGSRFLRFGELVGPQLKTVAEWKLPADVQTTVEALVPYAEGPLQGALVELRDSRTGQARLLDFRLAPRPQEREILFSSGSVNPAVAGFENGAMQVLYTAEQKKGDDQVVWNVRRGVWDGRQLAEQGFITRTDQYSLPVDGWHSNTHRYMLSADLSGDVKRLMLSGDSPDLIAKTVGLSREEVAEILPGILMTLLPALMVGLFPAVYILAPVLAVLFGVSLLRLSWAEAHGRWLLRFAVAGHILMKVIFAADHILSNRSIPDIALQLPAYLNTPWSMMLALVVSTAAAWWTAGLWNPNRKSGDFWEPYGQFAFIDLSIFILLVMPYYYAYVGLPVFLR